MKTELAEIDVGMEFWQLADCGAVPNWSEITVDLERVDLTHLRNLIREIRAELAAVNAEIRKALEGSAK